MITITEQVYVEGVECTRTLKFESIEAFIAYSMYCDGKQQEEGVTS